MTNAELQEWTNKAADALLNSHGELTNAVVLRLFKDLDPAQADEIRAHVADQRKNYAKASKKESADSAQQEAAPKKGKE